ncbi:MAG: hypothetical protein V4503_11185 [Gemmatimonadota bacterium]
MPEVATNSHSLPQANAGGTPVPTTGAVPVPPACTFAPEPPLRWEWRTFDYQAQRWARLLQQVELTPTPGPSSETYLLTPRSPDNVKIRNGRVEVKQLLRTSPDGLELWRPSLKEEFPLDSRTVSALCHAWQCEQPEVTPVLPTPEALTAWITRTLPEVRIIPIRKLRHRFRLGECEGEWASIESDDATLETLALEHHDPAVLRQALDTLRLTDAPNINYVTGLKRFIGWTLDPVHRIPEIPV